MATKKLEVIVTGDAKGALLALTQTRGGVKGLASQLKTLPGFAATAGVAIAAAAVAAGVGLFKLGEDFDAAFDKIRTGTGATGAELEGLKGTFKNVFASVPTDMASASQAVADLNTRLGLTGKPLERMATRVLELSRLTGEDLTTAIETTARVMGDWSIPAKKQATTLDQLFRASQETGIGVGKLAEQVVSFGAPMRQFGFSFEESIALMGKWEKEGVNANAVLAGLKVGLGQLLKAGKDPVKVLRELQTRFAATGGSAADVSEVLKIFGTRAGPDMVAALREGRFSIEELLGSITGGKETIKGAARDTNDLAENWNIFKNQVLVALEPIASRVFGAISSFLSDKLIPATRSFMAEWPKIQEALANVWAVVGPVVNVAMAGIKGFFDTILGAWRAIAALLRGDFSAFWEGLKQIVAGVIAPFRALFDLVWGGIKNAWNAIGPFLASIPGQILNFLSGLPGMFWELGKRAARSFLNGLLSVDLSPFGSGINFKKLGVPGQAHGGYGSGLTLVGEEGPELVNLPTGSRVMTARQSAPLLGGGGVVVNLYADNIVNDRQFEDLVANAILSARRSGVEV